MNTLRSTLLATIASSTIATSALAEPIKEAIHVFDLSQSAAVGMNVNAARSAGNHVEKSILSMDNRGVVQLRTLGSAGVVPQQFRIDAQLGKKAASRPNRVAPKLGEFVRSIPELASSGRIQLQPDTNIIGYLETLAPSLNCQQQATKIFLYTDGIESSPRVDSRDLLAGKVSLPSPSGPILQGCAVEMRGLAERNSRLGTNNTWFNLLRDQWALFFKKAGVSEFKAYAEFE